MRTLLDKLTDETKDRLKILKDESPVIHSELIQALKEQEYLGELKYYYVHVLKNLYCRNSNEIKTYSINPYQIFKD